MSPSRRRGHDRVAVIMDAAATVFAARGFLAATMTEIAVASGTAIGSLYRFFPTKDALADALFARYAAAITGRIDALLPEAAGLSPDALADRLLLLARQGPDRDAAVTLADTRPDGDLTRAELRTEIRGRIARLLEAAGYPPDRGAAMAPIVLQLMKALPALAREGFPEDAIAAEFRLVLGGYLAAALAGAEASSSSARTRGATSPA